MKIELSTLLIVVILEIVLLFLKQQITPYQSLCLYFLVLIAQILKNNRINGL